MPKQQFLEPTVGAIITNPEGKIFLMKSHKWKGKYQVPGGHIKLGEKIEDSLKREIKEETGLDIFNIKFLNLQEAIFDNNFWEKKHFIFLDYSCKTKSSKVELDSEGQEYIWVSPEESLKLPLVTYTKRTIEEYLNT